jgi:hypothetical protein
LLAQCRLVDVQEMAVPGEEGHRVVFSTRCDCGSRRNLRMRSNRALSLRVLLSCILHDAMVFLGMRHSRRSPHP